MLMRVGGEKKEKTSVAVPGVCMSSFCQPIWGKKKLILTIKTGIATLHPRVALASGDLSLVQDLPFPHLIRYHMWDRREASGSRSPWQAVALRQLRST